MSLWRSIFRFGSVRIPPSGGVAAPGAGVDNYFRPDGTSLYFRPDGTSIYLRPS